jgi:hypothetical protein
MLLAVLLFPLCAGCDDAASTAKRNRAAANRIVTALRQYHTGHGVYPKSLNELTPEILAELPLPEHCTGGTWKYSANDDFSQFQLSYNGEGSHYTGGYDSVRDFWYEDSK